METPEPPQGYRLKQAGEDIDNASLFYHDGQWKSCKGVVYSVWAGKIHTIAVPIKEEGQ